LALLTLAVLVCGARPAFADFTAFLGLNTTPDSRRAQGFAVGAGLLLVGFEFEYASSPEDENDLSPSLRTGMANGLLQTPFMIFGVQPYFTAGAGIYRERLFEFSETGFGLNTGGGVKVALAGPLRLRFDYRLLNLRGEALHSRVHRVYAGVNLKF
jgi:opacity protein-like surface antigen